MEDARLGSSGLKVSRVCLAMMSYGEPASREWHLGEDAAEPIVRRAVAAGVLFFDTADMRRTPFCAPSSSSWGKLLIVP